MDAQNLAKNVALADRVRELAAEKNVTAGQLALAWVLSRGDDIVPIPGTTRRTHLDENLASVDIRLTERELGQLDAAFPRNVAAGDRYPEGGMRNVNG